MLRSLAFPLLLNALCTTASFVITDLSDYVDLFADAVDNAIKTNYSGAAIEYQINAVLGPYYYSGSNSTNTTTTLSHAVLSDADNDTSVVVATDGATVNLFYVDVLNVRAGMLGLAMRGSGVREKLAAEFAKHVAEQLSGGKKLKTKKA